MTVDHDHAHPAPAAEEDEEAPDASPPPTSTPAPRKSRRGFASMSPEKQRAIASLGGKAAHESGTAHEFTTETAREAGSLGGKAAQRSRVARRADRYGAGPPCRRTIPHPR